MCRILRRKPPHCLHMNAAGASRKASESRERRHQGWKVGWDLCRAEARGVLREHRGGRGLRTERAGSHLEAPRPVYPRVLGAGDRRKEVRPRAPPHVTRGPAGAA